VIRISRSLGSSLLVHILVNEFVRQHN